MIEYIDGDMIITGSDAVNFVENAVHPNAESIARRDAFFEELDTDVSIECVGSEMFIDILDLEMPAKDTVVVEPYEITTGGSYTFQVSIHDVCRAVRASKEYKISDKDIYKSMAYEKVAYYGNVAVGNIGDEPPRAA